MVLNKGIEFQETSNTSAEMQLNENKLTNAQEFAKMFHISTDVMAGKGTENDISSLARLAAIPLMTAIQCALNKDFLLEAEKGTLYWAFDTKELLKGDMKERFDAYKTALDANFMQIDEVRYAEDLEPLGLSWVKLGLQDVLYDPKTRRIYTPNTNRTSVMGENTPEEPLPAETDDAILESRANPHHDPKNGRFTSKGGGTAGGKAGKTKYAPSPQRNKSGVQMKPKAYAKLCGAFRTKYPEAKPEDGEKTFIDGKYRYSATAADNGGIVVHRRAKLR